MHIARNSRVAQVRETPEVQRGPSIPYAPSPERILKTLFVKYRPKEPEGPERSTVRGWLKEMLVASPSGEATERYLNDAEPIGWRLIRLLKRLKIRVEIVSEREYNKKRRKGSTYLLHHYRLVLLNENDLELENESVTRHELGHALDYMIAHLSLRGKPASALLHLGFQEDRKSFVTPQAATKPLEYFAESVEAYFKPHSRVWLEHNDPGMHAFLRAMFELSNM